MSFVEASFELLCFMLIKQASGVENFADTETFSPSWMFFSHVMKIYCNQLESHLALFIVSTEAQAAVPLVS